MHYHHAWDGFYEGRWGDAKAAYKKIMRDPSVVNLVTVMREPVSHYMSYYYYFLQPEMGVRGGKGEAPLAAKFLVVRGVLRNSPSRILHLGCNSMSGFT